MTEQTQDAGERKNARIGNRADAAHGAVADGAFVKAGAPFSVALGYSAETRADDVYSVTWNGDPDRKIFSPYFSHGPGTFSLNPAGGLDGVYVGERRLGDAVRDAAQAAVQNLTARVAALEALIVKLADELRRVREAADGLEKSVPKKTSQLENDSRFVTSWSVGSGRLKIFKNGSFLAEFGANQPKDLSVDVG